MIQIPPSSPSSLPIPTPSHGDADASANTVAVDHAETTLPTDPGTTDSKTKFDTLFGAPSVQNFYADANGASGGRSTTVKATKNVDPLANAELPGQKGVVVQRSLGDPAGYETKNHALAWARAVGSDRAMVVLGKDNRWHAVETNKVAHDADGGKGAIRTATQVGKVDQAKYDALKAATKDNDPAAWKAFAAYALGVPESEIEVIGKGDTPSSTKININLSPDFDAEGRTANFDPKQPPWIQLGPAAFDRPANAVSTLAHEEVHAEHRRMTLDLYAKYEHTPHGRETFRQWVATHAKDYRKAEIAAGYQDGTTAATELEAHVEAARVSFASGDLTQARTDLNKVATLPNLPQIQQASIDALKALRDDLPADARKVFDDVASKANRRSVLHGL